MNITKLKQFILTKRNWILFFLIFAIHLFLRFYQMELKNTFSWDQVDNAWAAKDIIIDHKLPLLGMVAKQNSGFNIGPLYYYLITPFYFFFRLDPVASGVFAGLTSIFTFFTLFLITRKLFNLKVALISIFIYAISYSFINFDRMQWPVEFIPSISLIIFYCLYKIVTGNEKYLIYLAIALGFSFHIHFTSIFYPIIILLSIPFFPKNKNMFKYVPLSILVFLFWLIPNFISEINLKNAHTKNMIGYLNVYYHGLHLKRVFQIANDAFIQFENIFFLNFLKPLKFVLLPLFSLVYFLKNPSKNKLLFCYLVFLWFLIPWLVFSTYKGEITEYYFSMNKLMVVFIVSYLLYSLFSFKKIYLNVFLIIAIVYYSIINIDQFFKINQQGYGYHEKKVVESIKKDQIIQFTQGDPQSYIYYIYTRNENKNK